MHVLDHRICNNSVKNWVGDLTFVSKRPIECPPKRATQNSIFISLTLGPFGLGAIHL